MRAITLAIAPIIMVALGTLLAAAPPATDKGDALREAASKGDLAQVKAFLESGVPVDSPDPRHGLTALILAAQKGHAEVVHLLLEKGANVNARESFFGATPVTMAINSGNLEMARSLIEKGAHDAAPALSAAIERNDIPLARAALATGRITPLELKAARKEAAGASSPEIRDLLASATAKTPVRVTWTPSAEKLAGYAGRYRTQDGKEATVAIRDGNVVLAGIGTSEMVFAPVSEGTFETAAGDAAISFAGRAGLTEWVTLNRDGDLLSLSVITSEPQPLPTADAAPSEGTAERAAPRPWPQFRGANGSGNADGQGVPLRWDVKGGTNIRFKTPIPGIALSSPVIWGDRIFATAAVSASGDATFRTGLYGDAGSVNDMAEHTYMLLSLDAGSGKELWRKEVHKGVPTVKRHLKSSLANASPVTDGRSVVVLFGAVGVLAAYDMAGAPLWRRDIGILDCNDPQSGNAEWGHASSPIIHDGLVLVQADRRRDSFMAAYKLASGEEVWRVARDETSTWSTPGILPASSGDELITNGRTIRAYDPRSGKLLWSLGPNSEVIVATPVIGDGKAFVTAGYPPVRPIYAVRPGHRGDLTLSDGKAASDAIAWSHPRGGTYIPTPLFYRGHLYTLNNNGVLSCYNAESGERVYQTRLGNAGAAFSASPLAADGRLYFAAETGEVYVLRAGPEFALLSTNAMDEIVMASPAASNGLLVVRTLGHIVGIGQTDTAAR